MDAVSVGIAGSLWALTVALAFLSVRGFLRFLEHRQLVQLSWAGGLGLSAAAMAIEAIVYLGVVNEPILQTYVFLTAALVGVLSIGATRVLRRPSFERAYAVYALAGCFALGIFCFLTPVSSAIVTGGIITGNPPLLLLIVSTFVTGPATVVLLGATVSSLRRSWNWRTLLMAAGALVLGAGGTLYIASFPVALYYAEFIGIVLLFVGLISLRASPSPAVNPRPAIDS